MEPLLDVLETMSRWCRGNLSEIALALVGCALVLFGSHVKSWGAQKVGSFSGALRAPVLALGCAVGSGALLIHATPWVLRGLQQFNNYSLAPALIAVLVAIGVVADRK